MNCKPGDIAIVISSGEWTGINKRILTELLGIPVRVTESYIRDSKTLWRMESDIDLYIGERKHTVVGIADQVLKPLRDNDGEDEIIALVGKPETVAQ
jgi:hypothetical protein